MATGRPHLEDLTQHRGWFTRRRFTGMMPTLSALSRPKPALHGFSRDDSGGEKMSKSGNAVRLGGPGKSMDKQALNGQACGLP